MPFKISIEPGEKVFPANADQSILEAALGAGLVFPYGCRDGACGSCKGLVVSGEVSLGPVAESALSPDERARGLTLFCRAQPRSDLVIRPRTVSAAGDLPIKKLPCRVQSLSLAAPDVMIVKVKLPASEPFRFKAGQYIDFLLGDGRRRSFSIANGPVNADHLELHIRRVDNGQFTRHVFEQMKERDILRFEGPLGTFYLRDETSKPVILLAGGTGFAPLKGIVEAAIDANSSRRFILYWGARDRSGLYMHERAQRWAGEIPGFEYIPVLSDAADDHEWTGRRGLVHAAVVADHPDLTGYEVYACGAPAMIDAARNDLTRQCDLADDAFFSDAFTFASDTTS